MSLRHYLLGPNKAERERAARIEARIQRDGLRASEPDDRDIVFVPRVEPVARRVMFDHFGKREDQGKVGRCTAETMTALCEAIKNSRGAPAEYSPDYSYHFSRNFDGLKGDSGATPRGMCRSAKHFGMIPEHLWPRSNDPAQWNRLPTEGEIALGKTQLLGQYEVIEASDSYKTTSYAIKSAMAEGCLVALAFLVRKWHFYVEGPLGSDGHKRPFPMPSGYDEIVGGHMIPLVGYDMDILPNSGGAFIAQNSWGTDWGDQGLWSIPSTMMNDGFAMELRVIRGFAGIELSPPPAVPLTVEMVKAWRLNLQRLGLGSIASDGSFVFSPSASVPYYAAMHAMRDLPSHQKAQVVGLDASLIESFAKSEAQALSVWSQVM